MTSEEQVDRPVKRRIEIFVGRHTLNPIMRLLFRIGITPPGMALMETVGRRTGTIRHTPVFCSLKGGEAWLIAQHSAHAGWVLNFQAQPNVRLRIGRRWLSGTAELIPDDNVKARVGTFAGSALGRAVYRAGFRALESKPTSVRIRLDA